MSKHKRVFTLRQFIEAMRKNGFPVVRGFGFYRESGREVKPLTLSYMHRVIKPTEVVSGCALSQAGVNLKVPIGALSQRMHRVGIGGTDTVANLVFTQNDADGKRPQEIADFLEKNLVERLDEKFAVEWNDYE